MRALPAIVALLIAAAGWFYMFYSKAAHRLEGIEEQDANDRRKRLRRTNGMLMVFLGAGVYVFFHELEKDPPKSIRLLLWLSIILVLMIAVVVLGLIDVRLTAKLRRRQQDLHGDDSSSR